MFPHILDVEPSHICLHPLRTQVLTIHVLKLSKQQKPTNREAFNPIIDTQPRGHITRNPICLGLIVENDQTAHISLQIFNFQRAQTQNKHHASITSVTLALHPYYFQTVAFVSGPHRRSVTRFGEAVFRRGCKKPQEEKDRKMTFFSKT